MILNQLLDSILDAVWSNPPLTPALPAVELFHNYQVKIGKRNKNVLGNFVWKNWENKIMNEMLRNWHTQCNPR